MQITDAKKGRWSAPFCRSETEFETQSFDGDMKKIKIFFRRVYG